ncbi:M23 family metallopeptidase [Ramlibacter sp.]|uniref:M23 family metallopeptidase n=1 Tax=Ramlibacter sp. TaxID=1917967 RepID=UPI00260489D4|nr:M23 family metallopeptidase [Ramlibacter sp.]MDB5956215.1 lytH [Ramlibacter sp.]
MRRWSLPVLAVVATFGLQACDRQAPVTTVVPPTASLPDNTVLQPGAAATAAAPAAPAPVAVAPVPAPASEPQAAAPATAAAAPTEPAAPVAPAVAAASAPAPDTAAMGAAPGASAPAPAATAQGTAAPTEMSKLQQAPAAPPAKGKKVSALLPQLRDPGDTQGAQLLGQRSLQVPVVGIAPTALADNYDQGRGQRKHEATDILAPAGTPVVAVDDGRIAKLFTSKAGGLTIYEYDVPGQLAYYYAHLQAYAQGVREGMTLKRGDLIGYVGSTGNADPGAPHLHFAVFRLGTPARWWQGEAVNAYPALSRAAPSDAVVSR